MGVFVGRGIPAPSRLAKAVGHRTAPDPGMDTALAKG
ncbi:hypothetical protein SAMN05421539_101891 [Jannaschia seohaensis]|uniref:Uncharacterized protein n=1 Tax=Jannaschia seohaensis TaxID=475081 RepID=A0A2Y9A3E3_9RHOB|nr:hypothetical protein BCF38_101891 [Jannaschia seohaensis]SSA38755.1 hypothetical protein SAMN05421539_101891 [Jannaschia seohaensis]